MRLDGRRESSNVEDRRGMSGGTAAGIGLGGVALIALIVLLQGGSLGDVVKSVINSGGIQTTQQSSYEPTPENEALAKFSRQILASTEDVWSAYFREAGIGTYRAPTLVLYSGATATACGTGQAAHHVQNLLGTLGQAHQQMARMNKADANRVSVRIELQADFYAGVWGHYESQMFGSLEDGDLMEAINCASKIGDDYLQKKAQGYAVEESFTHGTATQRMKWLKKGLQTGDLRQGNTFELSDSQL